MLADIRRKKIVEFVERFGGMHIDDLVGELGVSAATVRRDLALLEEDKLLLRTRGGAVSVNKPLEKERSYQAKSMDNLAAKMRIAKQAAALVSPGMSVFLDAGTTVLEVAKLLESISNLSVITNDLKVALHLCHFPHELYFLGGLVQKETGSIISNTSDGAFDFSVDIAFIGASTISPEYEMFSPTQLKASFKRLVRKKARLTYLLADASKFGRRALFRSDALSDYSGVITDKVFDEAEKRHLKNAGVNIIQVAGGES